VSNWGLRVSKTNRSHSRDGRRRVVIIGPGKVGCGYLAPLFIDAGWEAVLAARTSARAERIRTGGFHIRLPRHDETRSLRCPVVPFGSTLFEGAIADAELVVTSVGVENVPGLGPALSRALAARGPNSPIDVWVVENADVAPALEQAVRNEATHHALTLPHVGFAGGIAHPVVARGDWKGADTPVFVTDGVAGLLIDGSRLFRRLPELPGVDETWEYRARLREKLFVFGAGHVLCAYLGALCGYQRIDQAARDPLLKTLVHHGLLEARGALLRANRELGDDVWGPVTEAMHRYGDPEIEDPVRRVARSPIRKLSPWGPLVGPSQLVREISGRVPRVFALGVASALLYEDAADRQANELATLLRGDGVCGVLRDVCGLDPGERFGRTVVVAYRRMCRIRQDGATMNRIGARRARPRRSREAALLPPVHHGAAG
jgi:mannitol-1-phosphate 5-dehydrogenase